MPIEMKASIAVILPILLITFLTAVALAIKNVNRFEDKLPHCQFINFLITEFNVADSIYSDYSHLDFVIDLETKRYLQEVGNKISLNELCFYVNQLHKNKLEVNKQNIKHYVDSIIYPEAL